MRGNHILTRVVSCPPCMLEVEQKQPATLPMVAPDIHRPLNPSITAFSEAVMLPKRVGEPSAIPSAQAKSSNSTCGISKNFFRVAATFSSLEGLDSGP